MPHHLTSTLTRTATRLACLVAILCAGCRFPAAPDSVDVKIIAFNDFHGHLEPPGIAVTAPGDGGPDMVHVPAGGAAYLASAIRELKQQNPNHAVVSAGDLIGASPLVSALFLDEPTIEVMNEIGIDFNAVGNHEFDKGKDELLRMQHGGCGKFTERQPCRVNKRFPGAHFSFLAANVVRDDGTTLFPATAIKEFGTGRSKVKVGFIGLTLKDTPALVTPSGIAGLTFLDEAATINARIPSLRAQGAHAIVVVIHEGATTTGGFDDRSCPGLAGAIRPILGKLDPAVDVVVSGHTHRAYVCDYGRTDPAKPILLTSAGQYGTLLTDINLTIDPVLGRVLASSARNLIVQGESHVTTDSEEVHISPRYPRYERDPGVDKLVRRYADAALPLTEVVAGWLDAPATRRKSRSGESMLGNLIADAQLAATSPLEKGGGQIAFMNPGGIRADLLVSPGGENVTYGQLFKVQPFGNSLVVKTFTGRQLRDLLEQQFAQADVEHEPRIMAVSAGFSYSYDLSKPKGERIRAMALRGIAIADHKPYRVTMNSYLAAGGDRFTVFLQGTQPAGGPLDVDALAAYLKSGAMRDAQAPGRITRLD